MSNTEAPTSKATADALAAKQKVMQPKQLNFVSLLAMHYGVNGELMPLPVATGTYGFTKDEFNELLNHDLVQAALAERGIIARRTEAGWEEKYALSPIQLQVANAVLDLNDTRSMKKKLQDLGTSTGVYQMWLKDEVFAKYLHDRAEKMMGENKHEAQLALLDKVRMGDQKAIEFYMAMTGQYVAPTGVNQGSNDAINFRNMLVKILEIINDEVQDPQTAANIADRLKGLIGAEHMANQLLSIDEGPIARPNIRELNAS